MQKYQLRAFRCFGMTNIADLAGCVNRSEHIIVIIASRENHENKQNVKWAETNKCQALWNKRHLQRKIYLFSSCRSPRRCVVSAISLHTIATVISCCVVPSRYVQMHRVNNFFGCSPTHDSFHLSQMTMGRGTHCSCLHLPTNRPMDGRCLSTKSQTLQLA